MSLQNDEVDQWYAQLSHIVRLFIEGTWGMSALEQTTEELQYSLPMLFDSHSSVFTDDIQTIIWSILLQCDEVKFAGQSGDESRAIKDHQTVQNLIDEMHKREHNPIKDGVV